MLGPVQAWVGSRRLAIDGARQRKLFALLLLNSNRSVSFDWLVAELWEEPPNSVRQQVHNSVGGLRRALAPAGDRLAVVTTEAGYQLTVAPGTTDLEEFLRLVGQAKEADSAGEADRAIAELRAALGLWRGEALAGLDGRSIAAAAAGLEEQRLTAVEHLMSLSLRNGEATAIVPELRDLVAKHPLRESFRADLMLALHRSGRQAEAIAAYDQGRRLLAEEFGLDPGSRLRAVFADILADSGEDDTADNVVVPAALPITKCFLPNDTRDFSGRTAELDQLTAELTTSLPSALVISAIDGMGGVGKTTLAVHLAHGIADDFPDGQYFIDLHGFSLGLEPMPAEQALDVLLRDCGVPAELVPPSTEARATLWRAHMAGKRAVIVLDNASDISQVRPLIPGTPGILVVVTSRRRLTALEGAVPLSLDVLPQHDAISLFVQIVGAERVQREPDAVIMAVELCGRLPLAIRIAAARLRDRRSWTVANLVERLETQRRNDFLKTGDRSVVAALRLSLRYLSPTQQRLFRLLSLHPGHNFDVHAASALAGVASVEAEDHLETLLDDNLLRQDVIGRYYFHDLVRDCARQLCEEIDGADVMRAAEERLLDYYLRATREWSAPLRPGIQDLEDADVRYPRADFTTPVPAGANAAEMLRAEYPNVLAVAHFAADDGWPQYAWRLIRALRPYLKQANQTGTSRALFEKGLRAAEADGDAHGRSVLLHQLAAACREHGDSTAAESFITQALAISRANGNVFTEASQLAELALAHYDAHRLWPAYHAFIEAAAVSATLTDTSLDGAIANNLAVVCRDLGEWEQGLAHLQRALDMGGEHGLPVERRCLLWGNAGMIEHMRGRNHEAARLFERVLSASVDAGYEMGEMDGLLGLCATDRALGKVHSAVDRGRQALLLTRKHDDRKGECEALNVLGEATFAAGDIDTAADIFTQARDYAVEYGLHRYRARSLEGFAHVARARGQFAEAREYWEQAYRTYPDGVVEREVAHEHLVAIEDDTVDCFRCRISASE